MNSTPRTRNEGYATVSVLIPKEDYAKLEAVAKKERTRVSTIIRRFVGNGIDATENA